MRQVKANGPKRILLLLIIRTEQGRKQGVIYPNKISGVGTNFGLLVHVLPGPNKQREANENFILS
jgi:hypothetical protein